MDCDFCKQEASAPVACDVCKQQHYCSDKCAQHDWVRHAGAECNVTLVEDPALVQYVPYVGEDLADFNAGDFPAEHPVHQKYIVMYYDARGKLHEKIFNAPLAGEARFSHGGARPQATAEVPDKLMSESFHVRIDYTDSQFSETPTMDARFDGTFSQNVIASNSNNKTARDLASRTLRMRRDNESITLWLDPSAVRMGQVEMPATGGNIRVALFKDASETELIASVTGVYCFTKPGAKRALGAFRRKYGAPFQRQLKTKFDSKSINVEDMQTLRATDDEGNRVQLTFQVPKNIDGRADRVILRDVEMTLPLVRVERAYMAKGKNSSEMPAPPPASMLPPPPEAVPAAASVAFKCDPVDVDAVSALVMALENTAAEMNAKMRAKETEYAPAKLAEKKERLTRVKENIAAINAHRAALCAHLEQGKEPAAYVVSPLVNRAIHVGVETQWQRIEMRGRAAFDKNYYGMIKDYPSDMLILEAENMKVLPPNISKKSGDEAKKESIDWAKTIYNKLRGRRGKIKGRLRALQRALIEKRRTLLEAGVDKDNKDYVLMSEALANISKYLVGEGK